MHPCKKIINEKIKYEKTLISEQCHKKRRNFVLLGEKIGLV